MKPDSGGMTALQVKEQIDAMTEDDRFFVAAYLHHLANDRDERRKIMLDERMKRMDAGQKVSLEQLQSLHTKLEEEGL